MLKKILLLLLLCSVTGAAALAQTEEQEANLKAAFIYNFTRYIEWDEDIKQTDFIIGVIGTTAVANALAEIARTNTVGKKKITIKRFTRPEEMEYCNILFIPQKSPFALSLILDKIGKGELTISEESNFAKQGTAFNFIVINDKLKFEANLKAINSAGLKAGSQLLKLAIIVDQ